MKKLEIRPSRANRPRNAFDLSQRHMFTAPVGALLPVMSIDLIPHDHVEINAKDFMRTLPMNSAAFMSLRGVYEFFFVPYAHLWHCFDQFIAGTTDYRSNFYISDSVPSSVPVINRLDLFKDLMKDTTEDFMGFKNQDNAFRLLDLLGYGYPVKASKKKGYEHNVFSGSVNPFRAAAYQKIYSDFYRNTTYEPYEVDTFNFDNIQGGSMDISVFKKMLQLRYRNLPLDYLTNLRPTPLVSLPSGISQALAMSTSKASGDFGVDNGNRSATVRAKFEGSYSTIDISSIRAAFALDKLLSVTMRAGKTYAEQMEAHFGVKTSEGRDGQVYYLGGFDSNFQTGDVTQTGGTTDEGSKDAGYLGRVVGKSIGVGEGRVSFDAKEHGVLMCIYSAVPAMQYDASRVDPFVHKVTRGDFFIPEFEDLGMQPLMNYNVIDHGQDPSGNGDQVVSASGAKPFGWQLRYSEYKTAIDLNHGQFGYDGALSFWTIARMRAPLDGFYKGSFSLNELKISPRVVDSVFAVNYNGKQVTDQLFGGCYFGITKISDMSVDGLPRV